MSTQPLDSPAPDYETQMMLILGKPGGGKGTISGKILKVRGNITMPRRILMRSSAERLLCLRKLA
jgi:hypothetical protein